MLPNPSPPSPSPPLQPLSDSPVASGGSDGHSGGPSLLIIVGIIAFVIAASASIHLILRLISRSRSSSSSSSSSSSPPSPTPLLRSLSSAGNSTELPPPLSSDREQLISSLPLFSLASSVASFRKSSSLDCAVCLSNFHPHDELRLLPACRHAFHSQCVDTWLRSTPSCPLCRASIHLPPLPPQAVTATGIAPSVGSSRSGSFRVELGSVSRRAASADGIPTQLGRSYSLGSSFEYLVDEEVDAVLDLLRSAPEGKRENGGERAPPAPGSQIADAAAGGGRGWLRDCVDRLTSSSSSSFNSLRFSGRNGSLRFDPSQAVTGSGGGGVGRTWDFEANNFMDWEEESGFAMFYRWLVGV